MRKNVILGLVILLVLTVLAVGCGNGGPDSTKKESQQQELLNAQAVSSVGMPAIKNFREKRIMKDIIEMRDQGDLITYGYIVAEMSGKLIYIGEGIGYPIPAATQFTNPMRVQEWRSQVGYAILPQADPNGTYTPESAEGTYWMMKDPRSGNVKPVYFEPRLVVSPFRLAE